MSLDRVALLNRYKDNMYRILLLVEEQIANPSQANIDSIVAAAATAGTVVPKPQYSLDGESYSWPAYAESLHKRIGEVNDMIVKEQGPFQYMSFGR